MRNYENHSKELPERQGNMSEPGGFYPDLTGRDLLNHLFSDVPAGVFIEITYILPRGLEHVGPSPITDSYALWQQPLDWDRIMTMNEKGYGVYYSLTTKTKRTPRGKRSRELDAVYCSALWVDVDLQANKYADKDAIHAKLSYFRPCPTALVDSGGGLHALWRIHPVEVTRDSLPGIKATLRGLALDADADTSVGELARVFRLPGTVNTKPERNGATCDVLDILPWTYDLSEFHPYRVLGTPNERPINREFTAHKPADTPGYVAWYLDSPHAQGERNNSLNWAAYKMHSDGYSQAEAESLLLPRALADGLSDKEALRTIASAFSAQRGAPSYVGKGDRLRMAAGDVARRVMRRIGGES